MTAAIIATALLVAGGIASGWITAYIQRGKRADADLAAADERGKRIAADALAEGHKRAREIAEAEGEDLRRLARASDADVDQLAAQLAATRTAIAGLPTECPSCGADVRAEVDEILWAAGAEVGLGRPGEAP